MDFSAFDTSRIEEYAKKAKESWGDTPEYKEYETKHGKRTASDSKKTADGLMEVIAKFGVLKEKGASDEAVQSQVKALQDYITANYYTCTNETLSGLGQMYAAGGDFTSNIDSAGGEGTAVFINEAIRIYCGLE